MNSIAHTALIEDVKLRVRNAMRHDSRVWHEALEAALDKELPELMKSAHALALVSSTTSGLDARDGQTDADLEALEKAIIDVQDGWMTGEDREPYPNELAGDLIRRGVRLRPCACVQEPDPEVLAALNAHDPRFPADAEVQAAWDALNEVHDTGFDAMRAALRAASQARVNRR